MANTSETHWSDSRAARFVTWLPSSWSPDDRFLRLAHDWFTEQRTRVSCFVNQVWCQEPRVFIFRLSEPCPFSAKLPAWAGLEPTCPDLLAPITPTLVPRDHMPGSCGGPGSGGHCRKGSSQSEAALVFAAYLTNSTVNKRRNHQK